MRDPQDKGSRRARSVCNVVPAQGDTGIAQDRFAEIRVDLEQEVIARDPHELMRALEASSILDCAEMAACASLFRTESRWGLYHSCVDHPARDDANWHCHTILRKNGSGHMVCEKRPVAPYIVSIAASEREAFARHRIAQPA